MLNFMKIVAIAAFIATETTKALNAALAARKAEMLELFVALRKEFDSALTDSQVMEAIAAAQAESAASMKGLKELKKEIRAALGLKASKTKEVKKANLEETVKDLETELAAAKAEIVLMNEPEAQA